MSQELIGTGGPPVHKFSCLHLSPSIHSIFIIPASGAAAAAGQAGWQPGSGIINGSLSHWHISGSAACTKSHLVKFAEMLDICKKNFGEFITVKHSEGIKAAN